MAAPACCALPPQPVPVAGDDGAAGDSERSRVSASRTAATAKSTSPWVVGLPRLKRSELCANWLLRPRARSTYEGSACSELQADPVETASASSAPMRLSPCTPSKET